MLVLGHMDEEEDNGKKTFVLVACKIEVEPEIQARPLEAQLGNFLVGSPPTAAAPLLLLPPLLLLQPLLLLLQPLLLLLLLLLLLPILLLLQKKKTMTMSLCWSGRLDSDNVAFLATKRMIQKNNHLEMMVVLVRLLVRLSGYVVEIFNFQCIATSAICPTCHF